jgi:hypothetical protein
MPLSKIQKLAAAAERYGDAMAAADKAARVWRRGDPPSPAFNTREPEHALHAAARAFATSTRKRRQQP